MCGHSDCKAINLLNSLYSDPDTRDSAVATGPLRYGDPTINILYTDPDTRDSAVATGKLRYGDH